MCSILGIFSKDTLPPEYTLNFKKALSLTKHRGPNQTTECISESFAIGFNRLSIVSEQNGSQPIFNEDKSLILICNGEIYNYKDLRNSLRNTHHFSTNSDCEVILHLYEERPLTFINELKGQFAFQIFDKTNNKLVLGRDRFGINPLYYSFSNNCWIVGSEIKSLFGIDQNISKRLDLQSIAETFILYGPTPPRTCFEGISQVLPGHIFVVDISSGEILLNKRYWELSKIVERSDNTIKQELLRLLKQAVRRRTQGDVKRIGSYLSGGLDSAVILALLSDENVDAESFSITFESEFLDESNYQRRVAEYLKIKLNSLKGDGILDESFSQVVWHIEHPLIRTAPIPLYHLSRLVSEHNFKIVLCGEGADELMLGYPVFDHKQSSVESKVGELSDFDDLFNIGISAQKFVADFRQSILNTFSLSPDSMRVAQLMEIHSKLSRYLLVQQGDRLSMSHGVEQRFPFLDEDLIDFLFSLPEDQFTRLFKSKNLLRAVMKNSLPIEIVNRQKQGYLAPMLEEIYESNFLKTVADSAFSKNNRSIINSYFQEDVTGNLYKRYKSKKLTQVDAIALLTITSTYVLHKQFLL